MYQPDAYDAGPQGDDKLGMGLGEWLGRRANQIKSFLFAGAVTLVVALVKMSR